MVIVEGRWIEWLVLGEDGTAKYPDAPAELALMPATPKEIVDEYTKMLEERRRFFLNGKRKDN